MGRAAGRKGHGRLSSSYSDCGCRAEPLPSAGGVSGARGPGQSSTMGFEKRVLAWHSGSWRVGSPDVPDQAGSVDPSPGQEPGSLSAGPALPLLPA